VLVLRLDCQQAQDEACLLAHLSEAEAAQQQTTKSNKWWCERQSMRHLMVCVVHPCYCKRDPRRP
jgi:hypothetical protein